MQKHSAQDGKMQSTVALKGQCKCIGGAVQSTVPKRAVQSTVPRRAVHKHSTPEGQYRPSGVKRSREALGPVKSEKPAKPKKERPVRPIEVSWTLEDS